MMNGSQIYPAMPPGHGYPTPSAPPQQLPSNPSPMANPHYNMVSPSQPQPQHTPQHGPGILNVPPMMYSVPGTIHTQPPPSLFPPTATLKPMPQPPPAPSLNEVSLNEERQRVRCPYCYASITTKVSYSIGTMTHIAALAVFVVCLPLFWVPYLFECCKDVEHACPNCSRTIGRFKRFE